MISSSSLKCDIYKFKTGRSVEQKKLSEENFKFCFNENQIF